ncbi:MAG: LysM peptidoglycan-binding domain-containing protein [Ilumatobacteraceae bacterium]
MLRTPRSVVLGTPLALALCAAVVLSGCGEASTASTSTVVNLDSTNYFTIPPTPSTIATTTTLPGPVLPGMLTSDITFYTVVGGDTPSGVAARYGITLAALDAANIDTSGYPAFLVGIQIKIPPGATIPTSTVPQLEPGDKLCIAGKYVIKDGDTPSGVASDFGVTLDDLNKANAQTAGYLNFIIGAEIIIPKNSDDC